MDIPFPKTLRPLRELPIEPCYASLSTPYHMPVSPTPLAEPRLLHFNHHLAAEIGLDGGDQELLDILSGNRAWPTYTPLASVYAGHQFGAWVAQLGDGRALTIAEIRTPGSAGGERLELQLKGAGQTPYSRGADGRAVLRSSIREYLCSEAMHALGIPTTRCLSLVASSQPVQRETVETAAVVCRVAPSFVRFGHFEFFYHRNLHAQLAPLADHVIAENFPHLAHEPYRYARWLEEVIERTARLIAQWQTVGFCHGVMNTDNFSVLGLTLDYGPFGFLDAFRQHHICNHSDYEGRYSYNSQPLIGQWNCSRLLQAALPLLSGNPQEAADIVTGIYKRYAQTYSQEAMRRWTAKLGLREVRDGDTGLISRLLTLLHNGKSDFTRSFRHLARVRTDSGAPAAGVREEITELQAFDAWVSDYRARLHTESNTDDAERAARMNRVNPKYVLRNHLAQAAIECSMRGDDSEVDTLMRLLSCPYDEQPGMERYAAAPPDELRQLEVSCSS